MDTNRRNILRDGDAAWQSYISPIDFYCQNKHILMVSLIKPADMLDIWFVARTHYDGTTKTNRYADEDKAKRLAKDWVREMRELGRESRRATLTPNKYTTVWL